MAKALTGTAVSIKQRLLNLARSEWQVFDIVLVNYAHDRMLYRLGISKHRKRFVLKGGMLVKNWTRDDARTTLDADLLGYCKANEGVVKGVFAEILSIECDDGLRFDVDALAAGQIRETQEYGGIRLKTFAYLDTARIRIVIDIGFGDAVVSEEQSIEHSALLDMPAANILTYPPVAVIAEKFQAIVALGFVNGRLKDYYDLWAIPKAMAIEPDQLDAAIRATFERRGTSIPTGLSSTFANDGQKITQWNAYATSVNRDELKLRAVIKEIWAYLGPACTRLTATRDGSKPLQVDHK